MREILFRGRTLSDKWVQGDLIHCIDKAIIKAVEEWWVIPETVGQYTGLTDKNGKKIFEGDICSKFSNYLGKRIVFPIVFELGLFYAKYSDTAGMPLCDVCEKVEVIGNIYDNPELLRTPQNDEGGNESKNLWCKR